MASARYVDAEDAAELLGCSQYEARALARAENWTTRYEGGELLFYLPDVERTGWPR